MVSILFVCFGNICRSPMAEFILKDMAAKHGISDKLHIESAATSSEELGNPVYPPAYKTLKSHGIFCDGHRARRITKADYGRFDYIIGMDTGNYNTLVKFFDGDPDGKISRLLDHTPWATDIADPWYTGDFDATWHDVNAGCRGLLSEIFGTEQKI